MYFKMKTVMARLELYVLFSVVIYYHTVNSKNIDSKKVPLDTDTTFSKQPIVKLADEPNCKDDLEKLCGRELGGSIIGQSNFAILECVQNQERDLDPLLSEECHHTLWTYKNSLSKSGFTDKLAEHSCENDLAKFPECLTTDGTYGHAISCMTENLDKIEAKRCRQYVIRFAAVVFSDYSLVSQMTENCEGDIQQLSCGRIQSSNSREPHSQGRTIECLSRHTGNLRPKCRQQILRLAELQSEDFHLDRAFYFACRDDRNKFCGKLHAGNGRVYKCLMKHKNEVNMSPQCADQLSRRQNLVAEDYKVSHGLAKACKDAIFNNHCRKGVSDASHDVKLSKILLCLETSMHKGINIDRNCQDEMLIHRQMVMENFNMSPDLVVSCGSEISKLCDGALEKDTVHCLMKHAKKRGRKGLSEVCQRSLEDVMKEADPGEDWMADPVLYDACLTVKESRCDHLKGGEGRVMRCLMRQLNSHFMTPHCEAALLEIQYFIARDWQLDPQLYKFCHNESTLLCHAEKDWTNPSKTTPDNSILVLPCLFRYAYHPSTKYRLSRECNNEVHRVMHERAAYVELHPLIEKACMESLSSLCSENTGPGEEMACLQGKYDKLSEPCQIMVKNYTEAEARDIGLNSLVMTHCAEVMEEVCSHILKSESNDGGDIMDCLVQEKNSRPMRDNTKCRAVVEDFQVALMEEVVFPPKFKEDCYNDVRQFCQAAQNRKSVIECLSKKLLTDTLNDDRFSVAKACRTQLRKLISQRHENIRLDPILQKACSKNIKFFCPEEFGHGKVLECLRSHQQNLDNECHSVVFVREQEESVDPKTDVILFDNCQEMLKTFCNDVTFDAVMPCLMREKDQPDFDEKCRSIVVQRMIERSKDIRLVPGLYKACKKERALYCAGSATQTASHFERNGLVIECLKEEILKNTLSPECRQKVIQLTRNAVLNHKMDPILMGACKDDMNVLCANDDADENGAMEECLKYNLEVDKIHNEECKKYIAEISQIQQADIQLDPLLNRACAIDNSKLCNNREQGTHLACLFDFLKRNPSALKTKCRESLRSRMNMFKAAVKVVQVESFAELVDVVQDSNIYLPLFISFMVLMGVLLLVGSLLGRVSKKAYREIKMK